MGELHLEILRIESKQKKLEVKTLRQLLYTEKLSKASKSFEGKSPNKHNGFY